MASVHIPAISSGARGDIENPVCSVEIPNHLLYTWYNDTKSYIEQLNDNLRQTENPIQIKETAARVEGRLRRRAAEVLSKLDKLTKRKKESYKKACTHITLDDSEIVKPAQLESQLEELSKSMESMR